jgi:hypothetical protein
MIVSSQKTGVFELFWRHHINRPFPSYALLNYFSALRQCDVLSLRHWLSKQAGFAAISNASDAAVLKSAACAVASGDLVAAENRLGHSSPGTGIDVRLSCGPVRLLPRRRLRPAHDLAQALRWLHGAAEPEETERVKSMLMHYGRLSFSPNGGEFSSTVEKLLQSGQLIPIFRAYPVGYAEPAAAVPQPEQPLPPGRSALEREEVVDANTFGSGHAVSDQVDAMTTAAERGIPFCEECEKARAGRSAA